MTEVEDYTQLAYQYYTQVPEELAEFLDRYREAFSLKPVLSSGSLEFNGVTIPVSLDLELREHPLAFAGRVAMVFQQYYTRPSRERERTLWSFSWTVPTRATACILPPRR
jgi:hypothetical protein